MGEIKKTDMLLRYTVPGFALGLILLLLTHIMIYSVSGLPFSFENLELLHRIHPFLWIVDFSPFSSFWQPG